jgi:hypothetical protein
MTDDLEARVRALESRVIKMGDEITRLKDGTSA